MICIGVDLGTQSLKVIVYDSKKHALSAKVSCPVSMIEKEGGVREQKAEWWLDAMRCCFSQIDSSLLAKADVISVSGQQHGFVPLSAEGHVLYNVKLWCDTSTVEECMEIEAAAGGRAGLSLRCGNPVLPGYTAGKIRWLYKHHRDLYDKISSVLLPHDYINWYLTGKTVMERGDASGTGLMNIFSGQWDEETVNACAAGLMEKLPEIQMTASIIGHVRPEAAAEFHLPESCLVACGGGDNMMSAIGTGCVKEGTVTISLGTSGTLFTFSEKPLLFLRIRKIRAGRSSRAQPALKAPRPLLSANLSTCAPPLRRAALRAAALPSRNPRLQASTPFLRRLCRPSGSGSPQTRQALPARPSLLRDSSFPHFFREFPIRRNRLSCRAQQSQILRLQDRKRARMGLSPPPRQSR